MRRVLTFVLLAVGVFLSNFSVHAQTPGWVQSNSGLNVLGYPSAGSGPDKYITYLPEATQLNNCVFVALMNTDDATVTVADDGSNSYTNLSGHVVGATSGTLLEVWGAKVTTASRKFTISGLGSGSFTGFAAPVVVEYFNLNGASCTAPDQTWTNIANDNSASATWGCGTSKAPTTSGDLILEFADATSTPTFTSYTAGSQANISWLLIPDASQLNSFFVAQSGVYNSTASFSPQLTVGTATKYLAFCVAIKAASAGSPSLPVTSPVPIGLVHWDVSGWTGNNNASFGQQIDIAGNAVAIGGTSVTGYDITSITATGLTFVQGPHITSASGGDAYIWYACNVTPGSYAVTVNMTTVAHSGMEPDTFLIVHDIKGTATGGSSACFDQGWTNSGTTTVATTFTAISNMTPTVVNELLISEISIQTGQATGVSGTFPNFNTSSTLTSGGSSDCSFASPNLPDECNGYATYMDPNTSTISSAWVNSVAPNSWAAAAAAFLAPSGTPTTSKQHKLDKIDIPLVP